MFIDAGFQKLPKNQGIWFEHKCFERANGKRRKRERGRIRAWGRRFYFLVPFSGSAVATALAQTLFSLHDLDVCHSQGLFTWFRRTCGLGRGVPLDLLSFALAVLSIAPAGHGRRRHSHRLRDQRSVSRLLKVPAKAQRSYSVVKK